MFSEVIDDSVLVFHTATIVRTAEVFHLPGAVDLLRHGVIEVAVEQEDIIFFKAILSKLRGDVFLRPF